MTFSIVARCERTGMFGIAISSSSPAVAARCAHVRAGRGVVASQNITDPRLGIDGLDLLSQGLGADAVVAALRAQADLSAAYRQLAVVDADGRAAVFSGERTLGRHGHARILGAAAAGNMLANSELPTAMLEAFSERAGHALGDRLFAALDAALAAGGEEGPVHSAGLVIADDQSWPLVDLRVDWSEDPITDLRRLWTMWRPQMHDYVIRAIDPTAAPSYGVPGDP